MMSLAEFLTAIDIGLIYGLVAIGIYLTFRTLDFADLTCDGSFVTGAALSIILLKAGYHPAFATLAAFFVGMGTGAFTAFLNRRIKISPLLSGILVAFMLYSINLRVLGGTPNQILEGEPTVFSTPLESGILIALCLSIVLILWKLLITDIGLALRSLGFNPNLAPIVGISVTNMTFLGLALSNGLVALGGSLFSQHQEFVDISQGVGTVIIGLTSVMIGEKIFPQRRLWCQLLGCLAGSILYRLIIAWALYGDFLGLDTQDLNLITGVLVIGIHLLPSPGKSTRMRAT